MKVFGKSPENMPSAENETTEKEQTDQELIEKEQTDSDELMQEQAETEKADKEYMQTENEPSESKESENDDNEEEKPADDPETEKAKNTVRSVLIAVAVLMLILTPLGAYKSGMKYHNSGSLSDITSVANVLTEWENDVKTVGDTEDSAESSEKETKKEFVVHDPNAEVKIKVPFYSQRDYPTGCELVSTSMLLAKYGIKLTAEEIVKKGYIKTKKVYLDSRADAYGPDPDMTFIGDPLDDNGYGCYSGAIVKALKKIVPKDKYEVVDLTGETLDDICYDYVDRGIPVLYWGSLHMEQLYYDTVNHWYIDEGKRKGEEFRWISNEHCMVLIGRNKDNYIFNDPSVDKAGAEYIRPIVEKRFMQLGQQAVAIVPIDN